MRDFVIDMLEDIAGDVNYYNSAINEELNRLGCTDEEKFLPSIDKDIEEIKTLVDKLTDKEIKVINKLITLTQTSTEVQSCNQQQLDEKIKGMAELINDTPMASFDLN